MSDFATYNTSRYQLIYKHANRKRKMTFRYTPDAAPATNGMIAAIGTFLTALSNYRVASWTEIGARWAQKDQEFFLPEARLPGSVNGAAPAANGNVPAFFSFQGITALGNRASLYVYGISANARTDEPTNPLNNYRVEQGEIAEIDAAIDALVLIPNLVGIDGTAITWYRYVNYGENSHDQRKARG